MNVKLIGKHEKDSRPCRDALALSLKEMMAEDDRREIHVCIPAP